MFSFDELLQDCRLLFGGDANVDRQFLESLGIPSLKAAFRRKALITHPDLFADQAPGVQKHHAELFIIASEAYGRLAQFLTFRLSRSSISPLRPRSTPPASTPDAGTNRDRSPYSRSAAGYRASPGSGVYLPGRAPGWPLRTGEFLYYSGVVAWKQLIVALVWQRRQRERIGEIAQRWGWLSEDEIREVAAEKSFGERLGEALLRHEWITPFQLSTLLWHQRNRQRQIGRFFVERGLIPEADLQRCLRDLEAHNRRWRSPLPVDPWNF